MQHCESKLHACPYGTHLGVSGAAFFWSKIEIFYSFLLWGNKHLIKWFMALSFWILLYLLRTCAKHFSQPVDVNLWFQAHSTDASVSSAAWFRTLEISSSKLKGKGELRLCETFAFRGNATWNRRLWFFDSWRSLLILNINQEIFSVNKIKKHNPDKRLKFIL